MFLSRWLFPGADADPQVESAILLASLHAHLNRDQPLSKAEDASVRSEILDEAVRNVPITTLLELKKKQLRAKSPLYTGSLTRRGVVWTCFLGYLVVVYSCLFYFFYHLSDNTTHVVEIFRSTASEAYTGLADSYRNKMDPATPQQVAGLMAEFYEVLAEMGYYDQSIIVKPPHTGPSVNRTLAAELGYSQAAVEFMEILPYLNITDDDTIFKWEAGSHAHEFLLRGLFADMRNEDDLRTCRDPYHAGVDGDKGYDEDGGPYMLPDYVCLSLIGDEGTMMVVNVQNMRMWTCEIGGNADPATQRIEGDLDVGNWLSPEKYPSRLARDALRDYIQKFITLEWMPGSIYNGSWSGDEIARLYKENGWQHSFDATAFLRAKQEWEIADEERQKAEEPLQELAKLTQKFISTMENIARLQKEIAALDAGGLQAEGLDVDERRAVLVEFSQRSGEALPGLLIELEKCREKVRGVDLAVRKAREEREAKYPYKYRVTSWFDQV